MAGDGDDVGFVGKTRVAAAELKEDAAVAKSTLEEYLFELGKIAVICADGLSSYLSTSLLYPEILPPNRGPDAFSKFIGRVFEIAALVWFLYATYSYGLFFALCSVLVAVILPFAQDMSVSLPFVGGSASLFLPVVALIGTFMPYTLSLFAVVYFTLASFAGFPLHLASSAQYSSAALTAAEVGKRKVAEQEVDERKKFLRAKIQSLETEVDNAEKAVVKAKAFVEEGKEGAAKGLATAEGKLSSVREKICTFQTELDTIAPVITDERPFVNILNHPLVPYQAGIAPLFIIATPLLNLVKSASESCELVDGKEVCTMTVASFIALSSALSVYSVAVVLGVYTGVSMYSAVFSLPRPDFNGGKWTPFRGGAGKVTQEIILNIANMNLIYYLMYMFRESPYLAPLRAQIHLLLQAGYSITSIERSITDDMQMENAMSMFSMYEQQVKYQTGQAKLSDDMSFVPVAIGLSFIIIASAVGFLYYKFDLKTEIEQLLNDSTFKQEIEERMIKEEEETEEAKKDK